jgi:hypothetical protein
VRAGGGTDARAGQVRGDRRRVLGVCVAARLARAGIAVTMLERAPARPRRHPVELCLC